MDQPDLPENPLLGLAAPTLAPGVEHIHACRRGEVCDVEHGKRNVLVIANVSEHRFSSLDRVMTGLPPALKARREHYTDGLHPRGCVVTAWDVPPLLADQIRENASLETLTATVADWHAAREARAAEETARCIAAVMDNGNGRGSSGPRFSSGGSSSSGAAGLRC